MKKLLFMSVLNILLSCTKNGTVVTPPPPSGGTYFTQPTRIGVTMDDGYYNGYSFVHQHENGMLSDLYMKRGSHVEQGPLMIAFSYDAGTTWDEGRVYVDGVAAEAVALWKAIIKLPNGTERMCIAYQDDAPNYHYLHFAYSDNPTTRQFTFVQTVEGSVGSAYSPCPVAGVMMPSGKAKFYYYELEDYLTNQDADNAHYKVGALTTTDGLSYVNEGEVVWYNNKQLGTPDSFGHWKCHETSVVITHNTGVDSTCKMIAWSRVQVNMEGATYFMVARSENGGATWTTDMTEDTGSFVDDNGQLINGPFSRHLNYTFLTGNNPVWLIRHAGWIYCINGERATTGTGGCNLKWSRATPDGAFRNRWDDWSRPVFVRHYHASELGNSRDCGYPCPFEIKRTANDGTPELWYRDYDVSTEPRDDSKTEDRCWIYQGKIDN